MRCDDEWYNNVLTQCRVGDLPKANCSYFHGLPALTSPTRLRGGTACACAVHVEEDPVIGQFRPDWKEHFLRGCQDMASFLRSEEAECEQCREERKRRHRVLTDLTSLDPALHRPPFTGAPALYTFNVPRYFATNLRAKEFAKQQNVQLSWCYARDVPLHPGDRDLPLEALNVKRFGWLRRHDQETSHIPSIYLLAKGRNADSPDRECRPQQAAIQRPQRSHSRVGASS